jgi:hypothetical protein
MNNAQVLKQFEESARNGAIKRRLEKEEQVNYLLNELVKANKKIEQLETELRMLKKDDSKIL